MSIKYMNRVWDLEALKGGRLLLMLALADHANDFGEAWPSQRHLGKKARLDERQVRRVVDSLVKEGLLTVTEKVVERRKRLVYRLFPREADKMSGVNDADILSGQKAVKMSGRKRTFLPVDTGHFGPYQPDIFDPSTSHAGSESPIKPKEEPSVNRIVSLDPWAVCIEELSITLPGGFVPTLTGSHIEAAGTVPDSNGKRTDLYRIVIAHEYAAKGLNHFTNQAGPAIRRKLSSILGKPVLIEIVAAESEKEPAL